MCWFIEAMETMQKRTSNHTLLKTSPQNEEASIRLSMTLQRDGAVTKNNCNDYCDDTESGEVIKVKKNDSKNIRQKEFLEVLTEPNGLKMKQQTMPKKVSLGCAETGIFLLQKYCSFLMSSLNGTAAENGRKY